MRPNPDYIHWLMIEQLTGEIGEADEKYLSKLLEQDPKVKQAYKVLMEQYASEDLNTQFERLKVSTDWKPMPTSEITHRRSIPLKFVSIAAAAAILVGILLTIYIFKLQQPTSLSDEVVISTSQQKIIKLQLAGGQTVDLSTNTGQVTVGSGALLNYNNDSLSYDASSDKTISTAVNTLTVPAGLDYKVVLSDGTLVWLNSSTILKFPFSFLQNEREITINGEAYLEVAKNADKPFIVHTDHGSVKVLGTQFNINTYDSEVMRVSLVDGAVQVNSVDKQVKLKPGQEAICVADPNKVTVQKFDPDEVLSWRQGIHHFYDNTVQEICEVFPRWYGINIKIDNKDIKENRFTGVINRNEPLEKFLRALKATASINSYELQNGELHLK